MISGTKELEEACLINSPSLTSDGILPYTDGGIRTYSQYFGAQMNSISRMGSGSSPNTNNGSRFGRNNSDNNESTARGSQSLESESGELIEYNDDTIMNQFHFDAIKQAGYGKFQILTTLIIGLGFTGQLIQVYAIFYILPSAELEYCIIEHEKNWLGSITFLGLAVGALFWGGVASQAGRRKALLSCLAVSNIFSVIAAFMPTYGPFMMARFCAAAGVGGAFPLGTTYLCEITTKNSRVRTISLFSGIGICGALYAGSLAILMVPDTGQMLLEENKEHFSAWHRYLLVVILPTFGAILGLFWLPESPRWLLDNGREVEALAIFQNIYRSNRARGDYTLTELELPGARPQRQHMPESVLAGMAFGINIFFRNFFQLFRKPYSRTTILLLAAWSSGLFVFHGLTIYISEHSRFVESLNYNQRTMTTNNQIFENVSINSNLENVVYSNSKFVNCTFRRIFISHVMFNNCMFHDTEFSNVKTSQTNFQNSRFDGLKLIDTDLTERHFLNCTKNNTEIVRLSTYCDQDFEYNIFMMAIWRSNLGSLVPSLIILLIVGEFIVRFGRSRIATTCFIFTTMLCCAFGFLFINNHIIWTGGTAQAFILAGLLALTILSIETYPVLIRCNAVGLFAGGAHIGALFASIIYSTLPLTSANFAALLSTFSMIVPVMASGVLKDPCILL